MATDGEEASGISSEDDLSGPQPVGRLLALTDGVFAIALTILVLNLDLPGHLTGRALDDALSKLYDNLLAAAISFAVIGSLWLAHHSMWRKIVGVDSRIMTLNLGFLAPIVLVPFGAEVLSDYADHAAAVIGYAALMVAAGLMQAWIWIHARDAGLLHPAVSGRERDHGYVISLAMVGVFLLSMPVAVLHSDGAAYTWLLLIPAMQLVGRWLYRGERDPTP